MLSKQSEWYLKSGKFTNWQYNRVDITPANIEHSKALARAAWKRVRALRDNHPKQCAIRRRITSHTHMIQCLEQALAELAEASNE